MREEISDIARESSPQRSLREREVRGKSERLTNGHRPKGRAEAAHKIQEED